jgi:hypothetical protein
MNDARAMEQVFRILRAQVPGRKPEITDDTTVTWLARLQWVPLPVLIEAAQTWGAFEFPALGEFVAHCDEVRRRIDREDRERVRTGDLETLACPECSDGEGWVPEPASQREGYDVPLRPCSRCNGRGFWLWRNVHYAADHSCRVCRALRKGNTEPLAEAMRTSSSGPIDTTATAASEF